MKILFTDKVPYLLAALIAVVVYQLNNIVKYVLETPAITYEYKVLETRDSANVSIDNLELRLLNINRKICFKNLVIDLKYSSLLHDEFEKIYDPQLIPIAPAPMIPDTMIESRHYKINRYRIPQLQPGGQYALMLTVRHKKEITDYPKVYLSSSENVWLVGPGIEVTLVKNQLLINGILLVIFAILIILYAIYLFKNQRHLR